MTLTLGRLVPDSGHDGMVVRTAGALVFVGHRTPAEAPDLLLAATTSPAPLAALDDLIARDKTLPAFAVVCETSDGVLVKVSGNIEVAIDSQAAKVTGGPGINTDRVFKSLNSASIYWIGRSAPAASNDVDLQLGRVPCNGCAWIADSPAEAGLSVEAAGLRFDEPSPIMNPLGIAQPAVDTPGLAYSAPLEEIGGPHVEAELNETDHTNTALTDTDLTETDLTETALTDTALIETDLTETALTDTASIETDLTETALTDTDLTETDLTETALTDTALIETDLTETALTDTDLTETDLTETALTDTDLTETDLTETDSASPLEEMSLSFDESTAPLKEPSEFGSLAEDATHTELYETATSPEVEPDLSAAPEVGGFDPSILPTDDAPPQADQNDSFGPSPIEKALDAGAAGLSAPGLATGGFTIVQPGSEARSLVEPLPVSETFPDAVIEDLPFDPFAKPEPVKKEPIPFDELPVENFNDPVLGETSTAIDDQTESSESGLESNDASPEPTTNSDVEDSAASAEPTTTTTSTDHETADDTTTDHETADDTTTDHETADASAETDQAFTSIDDTTTDHEAADASAETDQAFTSIDLETPIDDTWPEEEPLPVGGAGPSETEWPAPVEVQGINCPQGHLTDPRAKLCTTCGTSIEYADQTIIVGPRPSLGVLVFEDGTTFAVTSDYVIGRQPDVSDVVQQKLAASMPIDDPDRSVSRVHAEIRLSGWDAYVVNLASTNGSYVWDANGRQWVPIPQGQSVRLANGMRVAFGRRSAVFEATADA